jgi:hypothetical protein
MRQKINLRYPCTEVIALQRIHLNPKPPSELSEKILSPTEMNHNHYVTVDLLHQKKKKKS